MCIYSILHQVVEHMQAVHTEVLKDVNVHQLGVSTAADPCLRLRHFTDAQMISTQTKEQRTHAASLCNEEHYLFHTSSR